MSENDGSPLELNISLTSLNHLGINLYTSVAAVLSELVANAWDADAHTVNIVTPKNDRGISVLIIQDDGHGMSRLDVRHRYLNIGYNRRDFDFSKLEDFLNPEEAPKETTPDGRQVMGRKGIGKLSVFSIANIVKIETVKDGEKTGFIMNYNDIMAHAKSKSSEPYQPQEIQAKDIKISEGTRITLTDLKRRYTKASQASVRTKIARRFNIFSDQFQVKVDKISITYKDKNIIKNLDNIWCFSQGDIDKYKEEFDDFIGEYHLVEFTPIRPLSGWVGTFKNTKFNKDRDSGALNKLPIFAHGKLGQEDILPEIGNNSVTATSYMVGEVNADFLDANETDDIAVSSRQGYNKEEEVYQHLLSDLIQLTRQITKKRIEIKNDEGMDEAIRNSEAVKNWHSGLSPDMKSHAKKMFGRIANLGIDSPKERKQLYRNTVVAFEKLALQEELSKLDNITDTSSIDDFLDVFMNIRDIHAVDQPPIFGPLLS